MRVTVAHDSHDARDTLVFDEADTLIMQGEVDSIRLNGGALHSCTINGKRSLSFNLGKEPGLLNIDSTAFVVFSIEYSSQSSDLSGPTPMVAYVLVDSFLVQPRLFKDQLLNDTAAAVVLERIRASKSGNYAEAYMPFGPRPLKTYDGSTDVFGVRYIKPDQKFITSYWDFEIGEEIPSTISASVRSDMAEFDTKRTKRSIMRAKEFLLFAVMNHDQYVVTDVRHLLRKP